MASEEKRGKLSEEQLREFYDAFCVFDKKHKGHIGNNDIKLLMRSLGFNPTETEVENLCMKVDYDGNGKVDFNEFIDLMLELENPELDQQSYLEAFRAFDNTGRGYVNSSLIREILVDVMGDRKKDRDYILQIFQLDKDRKVSYDEFKMMISST
ncbi:calmodulin-alpha-like [Rhopilema esculentum]|uniref:calmodulin-alpha-like n=1 Tax=Rhopilema esculentum TaxID=499914 RepID=UPI0031D324B0